MNNMASRSHAGHVKDMTRRADATRRCDAGVSNETRKSRHAKTLSMPIAVPSRPLSSTFSTFSTTSTLVDTMAPTTLEKDDDFVKPFDRQYRRRPVSSSSATTEFLNRCRQRDGTPRGSKQKLSLKSKPRNFVYRDGRRYFHGSKYILPHDLQEIQRQNLNTILTTTILGSPLRAPIDPLNPPTAILELGCADGFWSNLCHDFFVHLGLDPPSFTGVDIAREGPDLRQFGVDWKFVNHDLQIRPLPFADDSFDMIVSKDMAIGISFETWWLLLPELLRILRSGGYLEFRDRDYKFRTMRAPACVPIESSLDDALIARESACYHIMPESEFVDCENSYLSDVSDWTQQLMESNGHHPTPMRALEGIESWPGWEQFEIRRIAIPLSSLTNWERDMMSTPNGQTMPIQLDDEQRALRTTALEVVIETIRSLEAPLRRICGKNEEEWRRWWNFMVTNLVEEDGAAAGECLEIGAAWGRKELMPQT